THYHELTDLENTTEGIKNYSVAVKKRGDDITFLRKIVRGGTDDSFGIEVAKLAGVPDEVISRAKEILASIDSGEKPEINPSSAGSESNEISSKADEIAAFIKNLDVTCLTPIEALNELYRLNKIANEE
ncbi:MAG: DNA mismatch repair protein MutS, partial [Clostridia bacterium]|nr:DNA mismatch repair protein MutS [Clostridia bacterium]